MATKPTPGGSDGTYGTELNAFLDVSLANDGKIRDGAVFSTSAAPTADAGVANKKYIDDTVGSSYRLVSVNGTPVKVYTKYLTGTLDADASTNVAHGVTRDNILHVSVAVFHDVNSEYVVAENFRGSEVASSFNVAYDATNVVIDVVGSSIQGNSYRIKIDYIL